ncbi:SCAN domain-containing protein 1 [Manis javanica]|uniref:SCAN domain-containing protein 1 n=1 Tax=Manis javanica TaxID=9974 RepID=UPI0018792773|nr:SCAN domain-containing protein 1-like [Manis javanica]XP_036868835.1 SCAN domain-containing protein 1-like [Manis javanica]
MTCRAGVMAAAEQNLVVPGAPAQPREKEEGAGLSLEPERKSARSSSTPEAPPPAHEPSNPKAAVPEEIPTPPAAASVTPALPLGPASLSPAPLPEAAPRSPPGPGSRPGPETFRQRFRQFRYQDAAGPREAFRQLRELSRQWLRPDIRTKEQIVEMLVHEQLLAIMPEAARPRRLPRRPNARITG